MSTAEVSDLNALLNVDVECHHGDAIASHRLALVCCGAAFLVCERHYRIALARAERPVVFACAACVTLHSGGQVQSIYRHHKL